MGSSAAAFASAPQEHVGERFVLLNVSALLPAARTRRYPRRSEAIRRVFIHQTDGGTRLPPEALLDEAEYFLKPVEQGGRGWPGFAYTYWVPFSPLPRGGRAIVYRCQPDEIVSNHTTTANHDGVAVAFQGRFRSVERPDIDAGPSPWQLAIFPELLAYLLERYRLTADAVFPHSALTKPMCPGFELEHQIRLLQGKDAS